LLGQLINKQYTYEVILCDSRKNEISILKYTDLTYSPKFKTFSELDIELQYYEEGHLQVKDKNFDLTKGLYLIKLNIKNGDDNRRRNVYERGLRDIGYKFNMVFGQKLLCKKIN
jgi:hypothetical protein